MKLVDELTAEHERIERVAGGFRTYARRRAVRQAPREDGVRFVHFFRTYAGEFHHAREEDVLFVALRERAELPGDRGPIAAIVEDHRNMAELLDRLAPLVACDDDHGAEILDLALRYTEALWHHIDAETSVLFPESVLRLRRRRLHRLPVVRAHLPRTRTRVVERVGVGGVRGPAALRVSVCRPVSARAAFRSSLSKGGSFPGEAMPIDDTTLVAEVAARHPSSIDVFERYGIDFCCGGHRPLGEVCRAMGLDTAVLAAEIETAVAGETPADRTFTDAPLGELIDHIVSRYHAALREDLPWLGRMADKVAEVHGARHRELAEVASVYRVLRGELEPHLAAEEERVFPAARRLVEPGGAWSVEDQAALHGLEEDHDRAGTALARLRTLSSGFAVPDDGCTTYRALYEGLARFERELHEHVHLENNVLFPRIVSLSARTGSGQG